MDKQQTIETLRAAKKAHIKWRSYALAMKLSLDINTDPVIPTECEFGVWYYGAGQALNHIPSYRDIEKPHQAVHDIYMRMYQEKNKKLNISLFGSKAKIEKERQMVLEGLMQQMLTVSTDLLDKLNVLENEILKMETLSKTEKMQEEKTPKNKKIIKAEKGKNLSLISDLSDLLV